MALNAVSAFALIWTKNYYLNSALIILIISTSACGTNICAVVGDLFPTHLRYDSGIHIFFNFFKIFFFPISRAMALSLIIMFSRFGGVIGSNVTAAMIYNLCSSLYFLNFLLLFVSMCFVYIVLRKCELVKSNKIVI